MSWKNILKYRDDDDELEYVYDGVYMRPSSRRGNEPEEETFDVYAWHDDYGDMYVSINGRDWDSQETGANWKSGESPQVLEEKIKKRILELLDTIWNKPYIHVNEEELDIRWLDENSDSYNSLEELIKTMKEYVESDFNWFNSEKGKQWINNISPEKFKKTHEYISLKEWLKTSDGQRFIQENNRQDLM